MSKSNIGDVDAIPVMDAFFGITGADPTGVTDGSLASAAEAGTASQLTARLAAAKQAPQRAARCFISLILRLIRAITNTVRILASEVKALPGERISEIVPGEPKG